ncbi:6662_t:CDS:2, partial [Cetraspora pellucida]
MDNLDFFDVDNDFGVNNNKSFMSIDMNYNESFMSVDMNNNEISGDFYNDEGMDDNNESELGDHEEHEENTRFAYLTHNHELIQNITMVESRYRRLTKKMQDDIRLLTSCGVRAGSIIEVLQQKNPEKYIHARNIANEVSTGMFADNMFDAFIIELEELISNLDHELYEKEIDVANQPAISAIYNNNFGSFEHCIHVNFEHIEKIRGSHVLDLSIATGRYEELYEMHLDLMKEIEMELKTDNNHNNFITTINNPVGIHSKGHNARTCNLDGSINQMDSTQGNYIENSSLSSMADKDLNHENTLHHCGICSQSGHNARTCNSDSKNKPSNNIVRDYSIDQENINSVENSDLISIVDKNSIVNRLRHCGACGQAGHNTRTCDSKN